MAAGPSFASPTIKSLFRHARELHGDGRARLSAGLLPEQRHLRRRHHHLGQPTQMVHLVGPTGEAVTAYYQMQQQPDGSWKINGVFLSR
ncbi:MAG: DUF4864 domain-containing protein [Geminicoccaceae bacterium]